MERNTLNLEQSLCHLVMGVLSEPELERRDYDRCLYELESSGLAIELLGREQGEYAVSHIRLLARYRETEFIDRRCLADAHAALGQLRAKIADLVAINWR